MNTWRDKTEEAIINLAEPIAEKHEAEVLEVKVGAVRKSTHIKVVVDAVGGVTVGKCARISRALSESLYASEVAGENFKLDVSSPGVERPLYDEGDFRRKKDRTVSVWHTDDSLASPLTGRVVSAEDGLLELEVDSEVIRLNLSNVDKGKVEIRI